MGVIFKSKLSNVASNSNFRSDHRFHDYVQNKIAFRSIPFSRFIIEIGNGKDISPNNYEDFNSSDIIYPTVNNFKGGEIKFDDVTFIKDSYSIPKELKDDDIIISRSGTVGVTYVWNEDEANLYFKRGIKAIPSGYLIVVKVDTNKVIPHFIKLIFNSTHYKKYFNVFGVGKTQKNIAQPDILSIPIPLIDYFKQNELLEKIKPIESEISKLKNSKLQAVNIINQVFGEAFGFDWEEFEKLSREKIYKISFSKLKESTDFRTATKFHSIKYDFLKLPVFNEHKFKDFSDFMTLGRQITPSDYEEESDFFYLMPNSIKTFHLEEDLLKPISESFYNRFQHISLKYGDLLLAASGEGTIGKAAIYNSEKDAVTSQFIMKIELNDKSLIDYFHYYMQSSYFQLTVEKFKKGMGNMTNIFVSQVKDFPVLYDKDKVAEIVELIKTQLDQQKEIDRQIEEKQQAINKIIEYAIKQEQN